MKDTPMTTLMPEKDSTYLRHESCPACGSSDANAIFTDGHKWCFSCQTYTPPDMVETRNKQLDLLLESHEDEKNKKNVLRYNARWYLPPDYSYTIPNEGMKWLKNFEIRDPEIGLFNIGWSHMGVVLADDTIAAPLLCFVMYDELGKMAGWQGRNFGKHEKPYKGPKYVTFKDPDYIPIIPGKQHRSGEMSKTIVACEDFVSAIKISRHANVFPLLGTYLSKTRMAELANQFKRIVIWLDPDATKKSLLMHKDAEVFFQQAEIVCTNSDPKNFNDVEIHNYVYGDPIE